MLSTHERAHTHVRTRSRKVTYSSKQEGHSRQNILGGVVPADFPVGTCETRTIPDSSGTHRISRSLPHPRSACQLAPPPPQWPPAPRHTQRPRNQTSHTHVACCVGVTRVTGILWERLAVGRAVACVRSTDAGHGRRNGVMGAGLRWRIGAKYRLQRPPAADVGSIESSGRDAAARGVDEFFRSFAQGFESRARTTNAAHYAGGAPNRRLPARGPLAPSLSRD